MSPNQHVARLRVVITLTAMLYGATVAAQDEPTASTTTTEQNASEAVNEYAKTINENEKVWLVVDDANFLALYLRETTGKIYGGVLIIPDIGHRPTKPGIVNSLRHTLSEHHWHTLTLDMAAFAPVEGIVDTMKLQKTIDAGTAHLNQKGIYNIAVIGEGISAALALHYLTSLTKTEANSSTLQPIRALIMLNSKNSVPGNDVDVLKALEAANVPILDASSENDLYSINLAKQRKNAGRKNTNKRHQQIRLPQLADFQATHESQTTKQIRGWLDKNIAGFMMQGGQSR